ncbi:FAD-dependent monooxygenase [Devosia albogilva]|uniref:FAD-dependent monooxygenase n=1 Tax=Devosia albogilva TaxID=429726 RepID=A0ABW5QF67_9HYPH
MPTDGRSIYIAGAGIAGLTLALALAKFGLRVVVLERQAAVSEFGAGLQISPNAFRILDRLGLGDAIAATSLEPVGIDIIPSGATRPLTTLELGPVMRERFAAPYVVMHRADLAEVLFQATRRFANIEILFGVESWTVENTDAAARVTLRQGGAEREVPVHAWIGADGVHSATRRETLGGPDASYFGRVAWRTLVPEASVAGQIELDRVTVLFGPGYHMVCYPLPHRAQVNLALFIASGDPRVAPGAQPVIPGRPSNRVEAVLDAAGGGWTPWPLFAVTTPNWNRGRIGLIGDAAHAMVPFQAQGAAMAIEDAAVLAPLLASTDQPEAALARYATLRQQRVARVARISRMNGTIFHLPWPLSLGRDLVIKTSGPRGQLQRLGWLYGYDAEIAGARP